jgi:pyroglutamyl-peptidase
VENIALVTGFVPFGGGTINPSERVALALDGEHFGKTRVVARILPVEFAGLETRVSSLIEELQPSLVLSFGLAQGEPTVRLERVAVNLADYSIPDNAGAFLKDAPVVQEDRAALFSTLPLRRMEQRLLESGIPATLSTTAGTYLCNATLYAFLRELRDRAPDTPCGFIHLPYLPEQSASALLRLQRERTADRMSKYEFASMHLDTMIQAARLMLDVCLT